MSKNSRIKVERFAGCGPIGCAKPHLSIISNPRSATVRWGGVHPTIAKHVALNKMNGELQSVCNEQTRLTRSFDLNPGRRGRRHDHRPAVLIDSRHPAGCVAHVTPDAAKRVYQIICRYLVEAMRQSESGQCGLQKDGTSPKRN